jgi:hypothetical protein
LVHHYAPVFGAVQHAPLNPLVFRFAPPFYASQKPSSQKSL